MSLKIDWETLRSSEFTVVGILRFSWPFRRYDTVAKTEKEIERALRKQNIMLWEIEQWEIISVGLHRFWQLGVRFRARCKR